VPEDAQSKKEMLVELTVGLVSAYVSNNSVPARELAQFIGEVYAALDGLAGAASPTEPEDLKPAVPIKKSVTPEYIICLDDGKQFKSLKRHLSSKYDLSPNEYRAKWGLPADYPMVAPNYAAARSVLAKNMGLGRKAEKPEMPAKRGRRKVSTAE